MVDYSRFDHIGSDSDDDEHAPAPPVVAPATTSPSAKQTTEPIPAPSTTTAARISPSQTAAETVAKTATTAGGTSAPGGGGGTKGGSEGREEASFAQPMMMQASKKGKEGRIKFEHQGRTVYEWEQSLDEVNLYIQHPPGLKADHVDCKITPKHLRLGIKGNPPFIDEDTGGPVVVEESYWMMEGGELNVNLQKMKKADTWPGALQGSNANVDPVTLEGMQKKIMLERFQSENPGFDFSGAEFNGQVPDARTFMGGVKYT